LAADGAHSAPYDIDPWDGVILHRDTLTIGEAAREVPCNDRAIRDRIEAETREIELHGGPRIFARQIFGKWRILKSELLVHMPRKKTAKNSKDFQSTESP
jgi:hypothetical protein